MTEHPLFFSKKNCLFLILTLCLFRICSMILLPVVEPSEARYAAIGKNMAITGNFLEPRLYYDGEMTTFEGKPPLFFQSSGIFCNIFGINEFSVRLPALLSAAVIIAVVFLAVKKLRDVKTARLAVLLCAVNPIFFIYAGMCMTDLMLCAAITCTILFYMLFSAETLRPQKKWYSLFFFAAMGVGMIVKGPVALVLSGMPIFFYILLNNRWKDLKNHAWFSGVIVFLLISVPWYWMMQAKNPDFLEYFFINENFKRFLFKEYGDRYGAGRETFRGMAVIYFLICNLPFVLWGIWHVWKTRCEWFRNKKELFRDPLIGFSLLTILTNVLFWSLTSRVLITYLLATIPVTAVLLADGLTSKLQDETAVTKVFRISFLILLTVECVVITGYSFAAPVYVEETAGKFFKEINANKEYRECRIYFARRQPFSAEFYLGDRVVQHLVESRNVADKNSKDMILLSTRYDLKRLKEPIKRKVILKYKEWAAFAPDNTKEEK